MGSTTITRTGGRHGMTLVEVMVSITIMALVMGGVLALQLQTMRMYRDVKSADAADFACATAVELMEDEIAGCYRVIGRYPDRITLTMPKLAWDAAQNTDLPTHPLQHGDAVRYYLSDQTGDLGATGRYLWRAVRPNGASEFVPDAHPLAADVHTLQFTYTMAPAPRDASVGKVSILVNAESVEGGEPRLRLHTRQIVLRNCFCGPVTSETGTES